MEYLLCGIGVCIFFGSMIVALNNVTSPYAKIAKAGVIVGFVMAMVILLYILINNTFNENGQNDGLDEKDVISYIFEEYGLTKDEYTLDKQLKGSDGYIYTIKSVKSNEKDYELYVVNGEIIGSKELYGSE
ncbi:hypothetical protein CHH61_03895 [Shouchella clausii]|uniref:Uncharacterized protein n=1 Tax=Shouchella clausii TaxID=79880 RepID=A0A268S5Y0_SHOCL|nr:hypothetical protein [Shouchella clausii]PAF27336.1 hypothetical protein CHH61_03895 [Shouchella clausii]